jgi:hypothetical protein
MKVGKKILDFLFGKDPQIFDSEGNVVHDLGDKIWREWEERFQTEDYNWHHHKATEVSHAQEPPYHDVEKSDYLTTNPASAKPVSKAS